MTIRTFKSRNGRITTKQKNIFGQANANKHAHLKTTTKNLAAAIFDNPDFVNQDIVLEIGFGTAPAAITQAKSNPNISYIFADIHIPGVTELARLADLENLDNIIVFHGDALTLLTEIIPNNFLTGIQIFFPDPWPKARHHKRRIIIDKNLQLFVSKIKTSGFLHIATDIIDYALHIAERTTANSKLSGGIIKRPNRPITNYENKAIKANRKVTDFFFTCQQVD